MMVLELVFGFLVLVAASYVGTTMALRAFFGREYYESPVAAGGDGPPENDDAENDDASRASNASRSNDDAENDDVPRASDVMDE